MKKALAIAALLLASTTAQAQYTFEYGGHTIRIDPDRGTVSIPGIYDNTGKPPKRARSEDSSSPRRQKQEAKTGSQAPSTTPTVQPAAPATSPPAPAVAAVPPPATRTAPVAPADAATSVSPAPAAPAPQPQQGEAPPAPPAPPPPSPTVAVAPPAPPPPPAPKPAAPAATQTNSPLGIWLTEEKRGKVRIEQCGANLCGYAVDKTSNQNREQILISMKPGKDKWSGQIFDPTSGSTYDSTIALKGADTLRVQGCAFGGMFCGGQTWTRVN